MKKHLAVLFGACLLSSCASTPKTDDAAANCPPPVRREAKFDASQYAAYKGEGKARINGRLCLKDEKGAKKCLANQLVVVNPVTDYSTEWFERHWKGGVRLEAPKPEAEKFTRTVRTDVKGYFTITNLPAGEYYVGAVVCGQCANGKPVLKYQRLGAKVKMNRSIKANLEPVFVP